MTPCRSLADPRPRPLPRRPPWRPGEILTHRASLRCRPARLRATAARAVAGLLLVGALPVLPLVVAPVPAAAHGAPSGPVSRSAACGLEGGQNARSAACAAAIAAGFDRAEWDNIRLPDVAGRDRERVPDGRLCSAGIAAYRGLDLPRGDWPATRLDAGDRLTLAYRATIPHQGTFRLYLTRSGYLPSAPLTWADLDARPFATVTNPALRDGAYRIAGRLPQGRTGRHVLYTVWQNSNTPDTYYSCSDLILTGPSTAAAVPTRPRATASAPAGARPSAPADPPTTVVAPTGTASGPPANPPATTGLAALADRGPLWPAVGVAALFLVALPTMMLTRSRTRRRGGHRRGRR